MRTPGLTDLIATPVEHVHAGDRVWVENSIRSVAARVEFEDGTIRVEFDEDVPGLVCDATSTLAVVDMSFFFLTAEEGLAQAPHRMREEEFYTRFRPIQDESGSAVYDQVPEGIDEHLVWTQVEGDEFEGWRDYALQPGVHRVNVVNFVICEVPWTDDEADIEVNWN